MSPEPDYPEEYYEHLSRTLGEEHAAWARLPREERERELRWYHENFDTADDLAVWPPELGRGPQSGGTSGDVADEASS